MSPQRQPQEGLATFDWPVGMSVGDYFNEVSWFGKTQFTVSGTFPRQEILNRGGVEGLSWAQTSESVSKHAFMSLPLTVDVMC